MVKSTGSHPGQEAAGERVDHFPKGLEPLAVAAENTRMPMILTDAQIGGDPVVFANDSFLSLTGFSRADILGKGVGHLLRQVIGPNTSTDIEAALDKGCDGAWEVQCRRVDGSKYLATVLLSPVPNTQGMIGQNFLCFVEVSGRINRLLAQRDQFNALYEQAPGFIATLEGKDHRFTFANASYKRLVGRENLVGRRIADVLPEIADQGFVALLDQVFLTGQPFVGDKLPVRISEGRGPSSGLHYLNFVFQPVRDGEGRITGVFVEGYDVTAERLAAEQLSLLQGEVAHASRVNAMGLMAATLAHELNQPLAAISTYAGASARLVDPGSPHAEVLAGALHAIEEAAQRAGDIIRNVRELTRRGETPKTRFSLTEAVQECIRLVCANGCPTATIDYHTQNDPMVVADRLQIQQVVINLLRNACDAIGETKGGRITVDTFLDGAEAVVSVTDTGPGLSSRSIEDVFEWADSSKKGGMGLGLSLSRTMIEAQDGRIWVEKSDSSGSQFCFSVPSTGFAAGADRGS